MTSPGAVSEASVRGSVEGAAPCRAGDVSAAAPATLVPPSRSHLAAHPTDLRFLHSCMRLLRGTGLPRPRLGLQRAPDCRQHWAASQRRARGLTGP